MVGQKQWWRSASMALVAILAVTLLLACEGDGDEDPDAPTATSTSEGSDSTATTEPTETGSDFAAHSPDSLDSYRYTVHVTMAASVLDTSEAPSGLPLDGDFSIDIEGVAVAPDREQYTTSIDLGFLSIATETVRIGDEEWSRQAGGDWQPGTPSADPTEMLDANFSPAAVFTTDANFSYEELTARLEAHGWRDEEVNGIAARRYTFTQDEFYEVFATDQRVLPDDIDATFVADIWLTEDLGVPIQMVIVGSSADGTEVMRVEMTLSDLNADIEIEPPI